ncbi:hypothetical protein IW261DRAFT_1671976 [Armillaria novae-zelandiae]|uniref:Fungal-type protein kinase domain-containing protein n=1 Tax=Armillaria novae-zelandiae TaxID=153914 RepID=A0AA39NS88_9AGAR|nr:hypothetical protein IW261DRAFT_1671976 [Armillaria novae-zelandiae]
MAYHRDMVIKDLPPTIPQVSLQFYQESVLPQVGAQDIDNVFDELVKRKVLLDGRWKHFPKTPSESGVNENAAFQPMQKLWKDVIAAARAAVSPSKVTIFMETRADESALSEGRHGSFKSDGHTRLRASRKARVVTKNSATLGNQLHNGGGSSKDLMACDLATIEEYKLRNRVRDPRDNVRKISGNAAHILYSDPCRKFIREAFNFILVRAHPYLFPVFILLIATQNPRPLIHYIISLVFASLKDLGFDPTVRRVAVPLQGSSENDVQYMIQYDYHVGSHVYRTVECLSSFRATGLISRGSRVWKVYRVGDPEDKYYALKDVWIPDDAMTEGEIQRSLFGSIQNSLTDQENFKQYFVEIEECEVVAWNGEVDRTSSFMRKRLPDQFHTFLLGTLASSDSFDKGMPSHVTGSTIATPKGAPDGGLAEAEMDPRYRYNNKKHCRILYKDVGKPLDSMTHPGDVLRALESATRGAVLFLLALDSGYVHRDLSGGNLIWMEGLNVTKITDMEYGKKFLSNQGVGDRKTQGTAIFMPVEIQTQTYLFLPRIKFIGNPRMQEADYNTMFGEDDAEGTKEESLVPSMPDTKTPSAYIPHNFLHDLESLWWIGEHALFSSVPASGKVPHVEQQVSSYKVLFPHSSGGSNARTMFLSTDQVHARRIADLPVQYAKAARALSEARNFLEIHYTRLESEAIFPNVEHSEFAPIYKLGSYFRIAYNDMYKNDTTLAALHDDYLRLRGRPDYDSDQELMEDNLQVAKLTGTVCGQEEENEEFPAVVLSQDPPPPDEHEDEEDLADIHEANKARRSSLLQISHTERPDKELRAHNVPNTHGKRPAYG